MYCYTNPFTNHDLYINLKYVVTLEGDANTNTLTLSTVFGENIRLHFENEIDYSSNKAYII
ncbi:MAG: hypothetical protein Q4E51_08670 [Lachnospiraceae bacterium]|nr:hypothetical protein [Lachnospiraceae bacterium]